MATSIKIILTKDLSNLGNMGDIVKVKPGYARNYLFPKKFALPLTNEKAKQIEHRKKIIEHRRMKVVSASKEYARKLEKENFIILVKSGEQGKLFGSIGTRDLEKSLTERGFNVNKQNIELKAPIKSIGTYKIEIKLEGGVKVFANFLIESKVQ